MSTSLWDYERWRTQMFVLHAHTDTETDTDTHTHKCTHIHRHTYTRLVLCGVLFFMEKRLTVRGSVAVADSPAHSLFVV